MKTGACIAAVAAVAAFQGVAADGDSGRSTHKMECSGTQKEVAVCDAGSCGEECQDCEWGPWSDWLACNCEGLQERHRSIVK